MFAVLATCVALTSTVAMVSSPSQTRSTRSADSPGKVNLVS